VVLPPQPVRRFEADVHALLLKLRPETAIAVPRMVGDEALQQAQQKLLVKRFAARRVAMSRARQTEDFAGPAFRKGEVRTNELDAPPSPRRA
jgi:hypothetical protein